MVHRIQNRNTGYSDFSNINSTQSFTFSNNNAPLVSHGANALKLENEVISENIDQSIDSQSIDEVNNQYHEELLKNQEVESVIEKTPEPLEEDEVNSNDLREFGVDTNEPDLFNSSNDNLETDDQLSSSEKENDDDDLEIPAFLRRQKN